MKADNKRKRINLSIKKGMQLRLLFRILTIILIAVILSGTIFLLGSQKKVASTYYQFHVQLRNFRDLILPLAVAGAVAGLIGALVLSLFFPLRLAGPLYRIEKSLEKAAMGDLTGLKLNIRSRDELQELASHVNRMLEKMREGVLSLKEDNKRMEAAYDKMSDALSNPNMDRVREAMSGLGDEMNKIKGALDEFKV